MSLIERALEKGKGQAADALSATPTQVVPVERGRRATDVTHDKSRLAPRESASPHITNAMALVEQAGFIAPPESRLHQRSEYRRIKRKLLDGLRGEPTGRSRVMLVTSAFSGEGKSFTSMNLALSLASEIDYATLLVDGDVIKPNLSKVFGVAGKKGLLDLAADRSLDPESLVLSTSIPGLSVLPAGSPNADATELLAGARAREVLATLAAPANRIVLIDSLPLLQTTEARVLANHAERVILVVRADSTPTGAITQAVEYLGTDANINLLLNAVDPVAMVGEYGYGQYYGRESTATK